MDLQERLFSILLVDLHVAEYQLNTHTEDPFDNYLDNKIIRPEFYPILVLFSNHEEDILLILYHNEQSIIFHQTVLFILNKDILENHFLNVISDHRYHDDVLIHQNMVDWCDNFLLLLIKRLDNEYVDLFEKN